MSVANHLHRIIKLEHQAYKSMLLSYNLSNLYTFLVTPKGKEKHHDDYLASFKESIYLMKPLNFAYYVKEYENTDHLHGVISIKVSNYKFKKMDRPEFSFQATPTNSLFASTHYMAKHNPSELYKLQVIKFHKMITYDAHSHPKGVGGLIRKNVFKTIALNPLIK